METVSAMSPECLSCLQQRTCRIPAASHQDLARTLEGDKGNLSHSLCNLESKGLIRIARTSSGKAEVIDLTLEGLILAARLVGSCD